MAGKSPLSQHLHFCREIRIRETLLKKEKKRKKNATVANKLISDFHFLPAALPPHVCGEAERRCWGLNYQGLFGVVLRAVCLAGSAAFLLSVNGPKCAGFRYTVTPRKPLFTPASSSCLSPGLTTSFPGLRTLDREPPPCLQTTGPCLSPQCCQLLVK